MGKSMTGLAARAYTTPAELTKMTGLDRGAVHSAISHLRTAGHVGDYWCSTPGRSNGFKILSVPSAS